MQLPVLSSRPVLGEFGKAIEGSRSLNFSESGGDFCDKGCRYHPSSTDKNPIGGCYAVRAEKRPDRAGLRDKLFRHRAFGPVAVATQAYVELKAMVESGNKPPWFRISTAGSVPPPSKASAGFIRALRRVLKYAQDQGIPVHFPVEMPAKADFYRQKVGDLVVVRESAQTRERFVEARHAVSVVAGEKWMTREERVTDAKNIARIKSARSGCKTIVCPAVAARYLHNNNPVPKAKCGNCTACANPNVQIVYPFH